MNSCSNRLFPEVEKMPENVIENPCFRPKGHNAKGLGPITEADRELIDECPLPMILSLLMKQGTRR